MKRLITIALMLFALTVSAKAQIFLDEEDYYNRGGGITLELPEIPELDYPGDQYTPLGEGILLLSVLGGAYLLRKRKSEGKE